MTDLNFFPGWVRKSITFTIDDGNVPLDLKFMDYVKPAGITGTFNLRTPLMKGYSDEDFRRVYAGYEIADHCRYHAYAFADGEKYDICDELFDRDTADRSRVYRTEEEGIYRIYTYAWTYIADDDRYIECAEVCRRELEEVFGKGRIRGYVWPCGRQKNAAVFERLKKMGFNSIRKTGNVKDSTGFSLPADRDDWSYNANWTCMEETGRLYDELPDDGQLKFYCFGVHSHDFENAGRWDVLEDFCRRYGNRPGDFWYATVSEIFDYEDAVKGARVTEEGIFNPSAIDLYAVADGRMIIVPAGGRYLFEEN
ncbi:MAG: polysaccharide deacetylase family protein [Clostridia bacterium]|nr:polysaccharide deacetylase family protein [Clostridia bacterium]